MMNSLVKLQNKQNAKQFIYRKCLYVSSRVVWKINYQQQYMEELKNSQPDLLHKINTSMTKQQNTDLEKWVGCSVIFTFYYS